MVGVRRGLTLSILTVLGTTVAAATVVRSVDLARSIALSEAIVIGRVTSIEGVRAPDGRALTRVRVDVEEALGRGAGAVGVSIEVHAWGGAVGGEREVTVGAAHYAPGERVLLQLERIDDRWHTLGLSFGKWTVSVGEDGVDRATRRLDGIAFAGPAPTLGPIPVERFREIALAGEVRR